MAVLLEPSAFVCGAAVVAALSPKSHSRDLFMWAMCWGWGDDKHQRDALDNLGRFVYSLFIVLAVSLLERIGL